MSESIRNVRVRNYTLRTFVINLLFHICQKKITVEITEILVFRCNFLLLMDVKEWISSECLW